MAALCTAAGATAQIADRIVVDGRVAPLYTEPFGQLRRVAQKLSERSLAMCTASLRGYRARWELRDDRLYLLALQLDPCGDQSSNVPLATVFPKGAAAIAATWYSAR